MEKIIVLGPTAVGKSEYALSLATEKKGAIISADSMQVYKYMNIGTAKLPAAEQKEIKHYMLDIVEPSSQYSVGEYIETVEQLIAEHQKKDIPLIFCGGTGLYLSALINGLSFPPAQRNETIRAELEAEEKTLGKEKLWAKLHKIDPAAAAKIHPNDSYRTKRALEVFKITGKPFSTQALKKPSVLGAHFKIIGLTMDKIELFKRIDLRVEKMMQQGLLDEVRDLLEKGYTSELSSMQAIGYKEIIEHLQGRCSLAEAVEQIKTNTKKFVKKQYTWFRAFKNVEWLQRDGEKISPLT